MDELCLFYYLNDLFDMFDLAEFGKRVIFVSLVMSILRGSWSPHAIYTNRALVP